MPRLEHLDAGRRLIGAAGAAAILFSSGCGGTADHSTTSASATSADAAARAQSGADGFCDQAARIDDRVDGALAARVDDDPSIPDAFRELADQLRAIQAPEAIATAWAQMSTGLDQMADAFADVDITDSGSLEHLDQAEQELTAASDEVETYLSDECGL